MFKKILLIAYLLGWNAYPLSSLACPEKQITKNTFVDSIYQSFNEAKEKVDIVFALDAERSENIYFFKRSFRTKTLIQKIKNNNLLSLSVISGGVFMEDTLGKINLHLIGSGENDTIASFSPSPNQIITIGFSEKITKSFFPKGDFFDPIINNLQNSKVVEKFPQLQEKKMMFNRLDLEEKMTTEVIKKSAEAICLRYHEVQE